MSTKTLHEMETDDDKIGGGINNDVLSKGMMQNWEDSQPAQEAQNSISEEHQPHGSTPVARSKDNMAKQC